MTLERFRVEFEPNADGTLARTLQYAWELEGQAKTYPSARVLADPALELPRERRLEYAEIILASGERLAEQMAAGLCAITSDTIS